MLKSKLYDICTQKYVNIFFLLSDYDDLTIRTLHNFKPNVSKKSKLAFWLVSACNTDSKRMEYVQELQKFIPVDIYGKCGRLNFTDNGLNQGMVFGLLLPLLT